MSDKAVAHRRKNDLLDFTFFCIIDIYVLEAYIIKNQCVQ